MSEKINVMLVDDHKLVREGVRAFLQSQPDIEVVAEAQSGDTAVASAIEHAPDVVLMDLIMPGMDGVEATRQVKLVSPRSHIIILTSYHQDEHIFPVIQAVHSPTCSKMWKRPYLLTPFVKRPKGKDRPQAAVYVWREGIVRRGSE